MATVTYKLSGSSHTGLSLPFSKHPFRKTTITVEELDKIFMFNLQKIIGPGYACIKDGIGQDGIWMGSLANYTTHQGVTVQGYALQTIELSPEYITETMGEQWYDYEMEDVTGQIKRGWNFVGWPFNSNGTNANKSFTDLDGRNFTTAISYNQVGDGSLAGMQMGESGWVGTYAGVPGQCLMLKCEPHADTPGDDLSTIKQIFRKPEANTTGTHMGPIKTLSRFNTQNPYKWSNIQENLLEINYKQVFIKNPDDTDNYGIRNIDGIQLLNQRYSGPQVPLNEKPHLWWGGTGHCDVELSVGVSTGAITAVEVKEQTIAGGATITETDGEFFDGTLHVDNNGTNHNIVAGGGQMVYISGVSGSYASAVNGFREVLRVSADQFNIKLNSPVFAAGGSFTQGSDYNGMKWRWCGDGYEGMARGQDGGAESTNMGPDLVWTWGNHSGTPPTYNKNKYDLTRLVEGTQGLVTTRGSWSGHNGGITAVPTVTGGSSMGSSPTLSLTALKFKASSGSAIHYTQGETYLDIGKWFADRRSSSDYWFGFGNGDTVKLRVWDPINQAMYAGKVVDSSGNPVSIQYYGNSQWGASDELAFNSTTGWKDHWNEVRGVFLRPTTGVGIRLYEIDATN